MIPVLLGDACFVQRYQFCYAMLILFSYNSSVMQCLFCSVITVLLSDACSVQRCPIIKKEDVLVVSPIVSAGHTTLPPSHCGGVQRCQLCFESNSDNVCWGCR